MEAAFGKTVSTIEGEESDLHIVYSVLRGRTCGVDRSSVEVSCLEVQVAHMIARTMPYLDQLEKQAYSYQSTEDRIESIIHSAKRIRREIRKRILIRSVRRKWLSFVSFFVRT